MTLAIIDWTIIIVSILAALTIGLWATRRAGRNSTEFFLSGRNMSWYLLGFSMVATTFSIDTPNLVSDIVRQNGVAGNWVWWSFLLTGMLTVFIYSKLWRRSRLMTDIEFYELRYSGKSAAFLRGFRAIYIGIFFNVTIMASVTLAAIKVGSILLNMTPLEVLIIAGGITVIYSSLGGLLGVLLTDFFQFIIAMVGSLIAAYVAVNLPQIGGLQKLLSNENVISKLSLLPDFSNTETLVIIFIIPLTVQWWSVWYPGSEPGGGGYIAQRMLAAKNEKHAMGATLFFNFAHYALRPWPWILVALASIVVFPDLPSIQRAFPNVDPGIIGHDMAYPAMLTYLPEGVIGLVVASLIAAYMSTMSTSLNLGSSYIVNDFYKRFISQKASEKELVLVGRISTVIMMLLASLLALYMKSALNAFNILLQIGAGTGLLFILRWFWGRINAYSEIAAMISSFIIAMFFMIFNNHQSNLADQLVLSGIDKSAALNSVIQFAAHEQLIIGVFFTTAVWIIVTLLTKPSDKSTLVNFYKRVHPGGIGWDRIVDEIRQTEPLFDKSFKKSYLGEGILGMFIGCVGIYSLLFAIGYFIYSKFLIASLLSIVAVISSALIFRLWSRIHKE